MLITVECDLFLSPATVLVNPVNTAGVMGSGVSAEFKRFFPGVFDQYRALCDAGKLTLGRVWLAQAGAKRILHLPVKAHWRSAAKRGDLESAVQLLVSRWAEWGIGSLAVPQFEETDLRWEDDIRPVLESALAALPIPVYLHTYDRKNDPARSLRQIDSLLNKPTTRVDSVRFWRELGRAIRKADGKFTSTDGKPFTASIDSGARRQLLTLTPEGNEPVVFSDSTLAELWTAVQSAGLLMAWQFPGAVESCATYLIPVLAGLDWVRAVKTGITGEAGTVNAMLFIPPPAAQAPRTLTLIPSEA